MSAKADFDELVKDALKHLYDYAYLEDHALALQYWPVVRQYGPARAHRLSRLLLETIEELSPADIGAKTAARSQAYFLLTHRYVDGSPLEQTLRELAVSRRQFFREQQRAISMLAALLEERLADSEPPSEVSDGLFAAEARRALALTEDVDISQLTRDVLEVVRPLAEQQGVGLEWQSEVDGLCVHGSRTMLRQVCLKVLNDLVTHRCARRVSLRVLDGQQWALLEFDLELIGTNDQAEKRGAVPPPVLEKARQMLELSGGRWQGVLKGDRKATYRIALPIQGGRLILVVEDNEAVIQAFKRYLKGHGYRVVGATSGTEALSLAHDLSPSAISLDVMMPTQDGWEILQALKKDSRTASIPVIICSVLEDPRLAQSLGAAAYLRKPVTQSSLLSTLNTLVGLT